MKRAHDGAEKARFTRQANGAITGTIDGKALLESSTADAKRFHSEMMKKLSAK